MDDATIVIRDGLIQEVGQGDAPAGARVWDLDGLTVYPGFIDAHADLGMDDVPEGGDVGPTHWNPQVRAWFSTTRNLQDDADRRAALRSQGFGAALAVPSQGIFRGTASLVNLGDEGVRDRVLRPDIAQAIGFQRSFELGGSYPNSAMGTISLMKQTFMDADWYERAWDAYEASGRAFLPPETSEALAALEDAADGDQPVIFEDGQRGGIPARASSGVGVRTRCVVPRERPGIQARRRASRAHRAPHRSARFPGRPRRGQSGGGARCLARRPAPLVSGAHQPGAVVRCRGQLRHHHRRPLVAERVPAQPAGCGGAGA